MTAKPGLFLRPVGRGSHHLCVYHHLLPHFLFSIPNSVLFFKKGVFEEEILLLFNDKNKQFIILSTDNLIPVFW